MRLAVHVQLDEVHGAVLAAAQWMPRLSLQWRILTTTFRIESPPVSEGISLMRSLTRASRDPLVAVMLIRA